MKTPFNRPHYEASGLRYMADTFRRGVTSGEGIYSRRCQEWLERRLGCRKALLTSSCTAALEMAALLLQVRPGDEVVMPSFTFPSTANAFLLRGAKPVFVDIRPDTMNLDETLVEAALTRKTKALVPVHYAGIPAEMDALGALARRRNLVLIEDAAQGILSTYKKRFLGTIGDIGTISFHETKILISGEGGALLLNDKKWIDRAEILREKGTDRSRFFRGEVDKYTWVDFGSSYVQSDILAAFLWSQFERSGSILAARLKIWNAYHKAFDAFERSGRIRRPTVPGHCTHNGHIYYLVLPDRRRRDAFIRRSKEKGIHAIFHYVPLHQSRMGSRFCRTSGRLEHTVQAGERIVRLPIWPGLRPRLGRVIEIFSKILKTL